MIKAMKVSHRRKSDEMPGIRAIADRSQDLNTKFHYGLSQCPDDITMAIKTV
jgi:hypothetical protein